MRNELLQNFKAPENSTHFFRSAQYKFLVFYYFYQIKGCSPLITASQYGRTNLTGYLLGRGARFQLVDREGDNALHWAAFKGNCEMCRLLIYSGFNPKQRDNFGQTPLHLGCLSGSLNTVQVLVEQDIELEAVDFNGNVPRKLAEGINFI